MIEFKQEQLCDVWEESWGLLREHFLESSANHDIELNPDVERYNQMEQLGLIRCYTARENGVLVGYAMYIVNHNLHYKQSFQAVQDVIFISKPHRKGLTGYRLIKFADKMLEQDGVQVVYQHVKVYGDFGKVLERQGYKHVEKIFSKRLGG